MRWQSVARAVVALIGIGCAVAVYVLLRPRPAIVEPPKPPLLDSSVTAATTGTKEKRVDAAGKVTFSMSAAETLVMADGRTILKGVEFKFVKNNVSYTVTSNEAEGSGKSGPTGEEPSQMVFRKKVKMVGDDGFSVEAEDATYLGDEQRVAFPGGVVFNRDRLQGRGVGADLYMDRSVFWLNDQSHMTIKPESGGVPVEVSGKRVGLAQADGYIRAEEGARLTRESQTLRADAMTVHFAEGTQSVRRIELLGKSWVQPTGKGQRSEMRGDNIDLDFTAETSLLTHARMDTAATLTLRDDAGVTQVRSNVIDFYVGANGETLTKLEATGQTVTELPRVGESPARTIHSNGLVAEGPDPKGLDRAVFRGGVQYRESLPAARGQAASVRLATSDSLVLGLEGALNQVNLATFRQGFCFVGPLAATAPPLDAKCSTTRALPARGTMDDAMAAAADEGTYDAKAETLELKSPAPKRPWVVNREVTVDAQEINIDIKQNGIDARWDKKEKQVDVIRRPSPSQAKDAGDSGLFESDRPITVKTNSLKYSKDTGRATYSGGVFMFQEGAKGQDGSRLKADIVRVDDQNHDIEADGRVESTTFIEQAPDEPGKEGPTRTFLKSEKMKYTEATRTAVYSGTASMETGAGANKQSLEAGEITLVMEAERRALKSLTATASGPRIVLVKLPDGRQATGLKLTYDAATDRYVVTGTPARFVAPRVADAGMCDVGTGSKAEFLRTGGAANVTTEGATQSQFDKKRCAEVLK